jgi:uncharacterized protein (TIGR00106 family)
MHAIVELQVIPLGAGVSVRDQVTQVVKMLEGKGFLLQSHASGTNIEGPLDEIFATVQQAHELLHEQGNARLLSYIKVETRTDKKPTMAGKKL